MTSVQQPTAFTAQPNVPRGPHPQQERSIRTRAQILEAASEIFAARGYRGASVKDIAERVGMTKGAVYFHFPSKESLAIAVVEEHYTRWPATMEEIRAQGFTPLETVEEMLRRAAQSFRDDPVMQAGARLQSERAFIDAELPLPYVDWTHLLAVLLQEARETGQLRAGVDPAAAARSLVAAFFGMQHISDNLHQRADIMERWEELRELMFFALRA
ncbi:ScbR family autoregulator-binding transcription factor [Streptomyces sp. NPDC052727]|uniref:ScbR family autoregulator-binding transcription factor n=1 Tax=unclassified Streptomyces TaxID=2593676 RepID=UPI00342A6305